MSSQKRKFTLCQHVLFHTLDDCREFRDPEYGTVTRDRGGNLLRERHKRAVEGGWVRFKPFDWWGQDYTPEIRERCKLVFECLIDTNKIEIERDSCGRVAWIRLTPKGERAAKKIAKQVEQESATE